MLAHAGIADARAEARDLVAALADQPRFWPTVQASELAEPGLVSAAWVAADRRARGMPFAYAVRRAAFRHLTLDVDERVLIPRQETEVLVDEVLSWLATRPARDGSAAGQASGEQPSSQSDRPTNAATGGIAVDVGTGSGAIALALASEGAFARVIATDLSTDALDVARGNAAQLAGALRAPVEFRHGAYLAPVQELGGRVRAVVSNPPYVAYHEAAALPAAVRDWEPALALFAGVEGMAAIATLIRDAPDVLEPGGLLALEIDARRAGTAAELVARDARYADVAVRLDLAGRERFVLASRR